MGEPCHEHLGLLWGDRDARICLYRKGRLPTGWRELEAAGRKAGLEPRASGPARQGSKASFPRVGRGPGGTQQGLCHLQPGPCLTSGSLRRAFSRMGNAPPCPPPPFPRIAPPLSQRRPAPGGLLWTVLCLIP